MLGSELKVSYITVSFSLELSSTEPKPNFLAPNYTKTSVKLIINGGMLRAAFPKVSVNPYKSEPF